MSQLSDVSSLGGTPSRTPSSVVIRGGGEKGENSHHLNIQRQLDAFAEEAGTGGGGGFSEETRIRLFHLVNEVAPQYAQLTVYKIMRLAMAGEKVYKHARTAGRSSSVKLHERRLSVVVSQANHHKDGSGRLEVLMQYKKMMSKKTYQIVGGVLACAPVDSRKDLRLVVNTDQGMVVLTCAKVEHWCMFALAINAGLHFRDNTLARGVQTPLRELPWHRNVQVYEALK